MNTYEIEAREIAVHIKELHGRVARFSAHPTLHTRVPGVKAEISALEKRLPKMVATGRWAKEFYAAR